MGAGESGVGAARLAKLKGYSVLVSDMNSIKDEYKKELAQHDIQFEEGGHSSELIQAELIIKSPGIPDNAEAVLKAKNAGISIISEIEFAARFTKACLIGITGTNGKTTTAMLTYHLLKEGGLQVGLAGNVGDSFARQVATKDQDYYVLELSSFQLDGMFDTRLDYAVLLNISPDHLDRYESFEDYIQSKFRIAQNQSKEQKFIKIFFKFLNKI